MPKNGTFGSWSYYKVANKVKARDGARCTICGQGEEDGAIIEIDHLRPRSRGGEDVPDNLRATCRACNRIRGNRAMSDAAVRAGRQAQAARKPTTRGMFSDRPEKPAASPTFREAPARYGFGVHLHVFANGLAAVIGDYGHTWTGAGCPSNCDLEKGRS